MHSEISITLRSLLNHGASHLGCMFGNRQVPTWGGSFLVVHVGLQDHKIWLWSTWVTTYTGTLSWYHWALNADVSPVRELDRAKTSANHVCDWSSITGAGGINLRTFVTWNFGGCVCCLCLWPPTPKNTCFFKHYNKGRGITADLSVLLSSSLVLTTETSWYSLFILLVFFFFHAKTLILNLTWNPRHVWGTFPLKVYWVCVARFW